MPNAVPSIEIDKYLEFIIFKIIIIYLNAKIFYLKLISNLISEPIIS